MITRKKATLVQETQIESCFQCPHLKRDGTCDHETTQAWWGIPSEYKTLERWSILNNYQIPDWCPILEENKFYATITLPKDSVLADLLEERGYVEAANKLRI